MGGRRVAVALAALSAATVPLVAPAALATTVEPPCEDADLQVTVVETKDRTNGIWARLDVTNAGDCPVDQVAIGLPLVHGHLLAAYADGTAPGPWPVTSLPGVEALTYGLEILEGGETRRLDIASDWAAGTTPTAVIIGLDSEPRDPTPEDAVVHLDVTPVPTSAAFPDVPTDSPFTGDIAWLAHHRLAEGYLDGGFHPSAPVSRQAIAAMLWRLAGRPQLPFTPAESPYPFDDLDHDHPFALAIDWAQGRDVVGGYADGGYHPTATVSRQALVAMLWRLAGSPTGAPDPGYPDVPPGHPFADAIAWATDTGLATGYADGGFHPASPVSRQAAAAWITRFADTP